MWQCRTGGGAQAMGAEQQVRRAQRWAEDPRAPAAAAALAALPPEVKARVLEAASVGRSITIHKVAPQLPRANSDGALSPAEWRHGCMATAATLIVPQPRPLCLGAALIWAVPPVRALWRLRSELAGHGGSA